MKRRVKLFLIIIVGSLLSIIIYLTTYKENKDIVLIGDSCPLDGIVNNKTIHKEFVINNLKSYELIEMLLNNVNNKSINIKEQIYKANKVFIYIGEYELKEGENINTYIFNMDKIVSIIKNINKNKIYLVGIKGTDNKIIKINEWLNKISDKYNVNYIDINTDNIYKYIDTEYY